MSLDEIEDAVNRYKARTIVFTDDEFTLGKRFVYEFLRELDERGLDINFSCGSRVDTMDREMMKALMDHGCTASTSGLSQPAKIL